MNFGQGLQSLRSVGNEINLINSNLNGTNIVGFKQNSGYYGGTGAQVKNSYQIPDTSLINAYTELNFSQGQINYTGEKTDFAINGEGFFLLQQVQDVGVNPPNLVTRDGNFRFLNVPSLGGDILGNANGLVVLRDSSGTGAGPYVPITKTDLLQNGILPSVVKPEKGNEQLVFSKNGSSVFTFNDNVVLADGEVVQGSLEASNVNTHEALVALSLAQKKFQAMAVQIKNENTLLDIVTNIIK
ncbi:MAG: flagellar basal-body rod protein FlgG [Candidatus Sericytochromatia bacterium]|nr:MAG: flagellar basal-body rod protein FlgG [Candidatus Sericytochromatia bacterium]